jgi:hypothetical protein
VARWKRFEWQLVDVVAPRLRGADDRLVTLDPLSRCLILAGANPPDEIRKSGVLRHVQVPSGQREVAPMIVPDVRH